MGNKNKTNSNLDFSKINPITSGLMMASIIFGSAVVLMPGIVSNLGLMSFTMLLFWCFTLFYYSEILAAQVFGEILSMKNKKNYDADAAERRPLQYCFQIAFGKQPFMIELTSLFQMVSIATLIASYLLILATTLQATFPPLSTHLSPQNTTRVWIFIVFISILPLHFIGNYKGMSYLGTLATMVIFLALVAVLIASVIVSVSNIPEPSHEQKILLKSKHMLKTNNALFILLSSFGSIAFVTSGSMTTLPNIASFMPDTESLRIASSLCKLTLFVLYFIAGVVPYYLLKDYVIDASIMVTLQRVANTSNISSLNMVCRLNELFTFIHFVCAIVIGANPLHLLLETIFKVPNSKL